MFNLSFDTPLSDSFHILVLQLKDSVSHMSPLTAALVYVYVFIDTKKIPISIQFVYIYIVIQIIYFIAMHNSIEIVGCYYYEVIYVFSNFYYYLEKYQLSC